MKKVTKSLFSILMVLAISLSYITPITKVIALSYGEGDSFITMEIGNGLGFTINSVTVNGHEWTSNEDQFHTNNNQYHIEINVSGNESTGNKVPRIQYGGNWNTDITPSTQHNGNSHTFILDVNNSNHQEFLGFMLEEEMANQNPGNNSGNENVNEPHFDGKAYVVWSCGTGTCYHYMNDIPNFDDGISTFYKDTDIIADNKDDVKFDVHAKTIFFAEKAKFDEWVNDNGGNTINWDTINTANLVGPDGIDFQPLGEPDENNAYVSYGDRNFKIVIYNSSYKGISMGSLEDLNYYPSSWNNPFIMRDQFDISGTTKANPAVVDSVLLENTVIIKPLDYNDFEIVSMEALDVPKNAVTITKVNKEFRLVFSSNFYDNVIFKVKDNKNQISYLQVKRYTIDSWIKHDDNHAILTADFYFDRNKSYNDFDITAKIIYKDGTRKNVNLTAVYGIDDGLGNITPAYEVDEQVVGGKGLKKSTFDYQLEDGEEDNIDKVYLNVENKGSTFTNYAGAYVGSGKGVEANIYHEEEE